ncbi:MAG: hypothetical protein SVK54_03135 [candidate division WOR-3 bacterium]|nr:hypothetical protein [candidate division WOR-3 bacterium]
MTEFGKISVISLLIILTAGCSRQENARAPAENMIAGVTIRSFKNDSADYTLDADTAYLSGDSLKILKNVMFKRRDITIISDSSFMSDSFISYMSDVKIYLEDSMNLFTDYIIYSIYNDSVKTEDSLLIQKDNDFMKTRGMDTDINFNSIEFRNPVIIYDKDN